MHRYVHWTPMTNTVELPRVLPAVPTGEPPTVELGVLDLPPAVTPTRRDRVATTLRAAIATVIAADLAGIAYVLGTQL